MVKLQDIRVARKLAIAFGTIIVIVLGASIYIYRETKSLQQIQRLNLASDRAADMIDRLAGDFARAQSNARKVAVTGAEIDGDGFRQATAAYAVDLRAARQILLDDAPNLVPLLDDYDKAVGDYVSTYLAQEVKLATSPATRSQALDMVASPASQPAVADLAERSGKVRTAVAAWSQAWTEAGEQSMASMLVVVVASGLVSTLLAVVMAWLITRALANPITAMAGAMQGLARGDHGVTVPAQGRRDEIGTMAEAVQVFKAAAIEKARLEADALVAGRMTEAERARNAAVLAETAERQTAVVDRVASGLSHLSTGDLAHRIDEVFPAEYEKLRGDFNNAMAKLQETMHRVTASAATIGEGTGEISTAADDLSRRTEQQAASLEETAAALDEITATVRRTAEGAKQARTVVGSTKGSAERSGQIVRQAVQAMSEIERSAREVSQIIGVIDEIAFQTNLLALNAGVEAARAGDAGRGFAVVASEVRALAQRSAEAAKEIKGLIAMSGAQVAEGVVFVGQTGDALSSIVVQVAEIDGIVGEIAASAQEQASALDEVNTAVNQMDQVTQQNAAMVEETTAASHALAGEVKALTGLIGRFRLGHAGKAASATVARFEHRSAA